MPDLQCLSAMTDGNTMIDTLALDAFLKRQAFQFVVPVSRIGVNMCCHVHCLCLLRFILHDARSA